VLLQQSVFWASSLLCNAFSSFEGLLFLLVEDSRVRNPSDFGGFFGLGRVVQASGDFFFFFCRGGKKIQAFWVQRHG